MGAGFERFQKIHLLCLLSTRIKGMFYHTWFKFIKTNKNKVLSKYVLKILFFCLFLETGSLPRPGLPQLDLPTSASTVLGL